MVPLSKPLGSMVRPTGRPDAEKVYDGTPPEIVEGLALQSRLSDGVSQNECSKGFPIIAGPIFAGNVNVGGRCLTTMVSSKGPPTVPFESVIVKLNGKLREVEVIGIVGAMPMIVQSTNWIVPGSEEPDARAHL